MVNDGDQSQYPLVNIQKTIKNHNFQWENSHYQWLFSIFCAMNGTFTLWQTNITMEHHHLIAGQINYFDWAI